MRFPYTTVITLADAVDLEVEVSNNVVKEKQSTKEVDSAAKMQRLAEEMRFRIKEAMAQRGGSQAFLHYLQTNEGKKA